MGTALGVRPVVGRPVNDSHTEAHSPSERPLLQFLAASRPERPGRGSAVSMATAVVAHAAVLTLAVWATLSADPSVRVLDEQTQDHIVDLVPPAVLTHPDARDGATTAERARTVARTPARPRPRAPGSALLAARLLEPPALGEPVAAVAPPPAVFAALDRSEYAGLGSDSAYSAAQIVSDRHEPSADDLAAAPPRLVGYTEPPELSNTDFVRKRLEREYPSYLQDEGIGGRVVLWFLVDETGKVRKWLMKQSSGHAALDRAAMKVAALMRFRPALNYDHHVAVWVALPVYFQTVEAAG